MPPPQKCTIGHFTTLHYRTLHGYQRNASPLPHKCPREECCPPQDILGLTLVLLTFLASMFLIHLVAWHCGSIIRGHLETEARLQHYHLSPSGVGFQGPSGQGDWELQQAQDGGLDPGTGRLARVREEPSQEPGEASAHRLPLVTMIPFSVEKLSEGSPWMFQLRTMVGLERKPSQVKPGEQGTWSSRICTEYVDQPGARGTRPGPGLLLLPIPQGQNLSRDPWFRWAGGFERDCQWPTTMAPPSGLPSFKGGWQPSPNKASC